MKAGPKFGQDPSNLIQLMTYTNVWANRTQFFFGAEIVSYLPKHIHTCSTPQWQPGMASRKYPRTGPDYPRKAAVRHYLHPNSSGVPYRYVNNYRLCLDA